MSCFRPLGAYRDKTGAVKIGDGSPTSIESFFVPCGRCVGCKLERSRAWSVRIVHEAQLYDANRFVTLTYSDEKLPASRSLEYRDFQLFMKRLRKRLRGHSEGPEGGYPLRFFCAGEYGSVRSRPHFHAILFNLKLPDEELWINGEYHSPLLEELWQKGTVQIGPVNAGTAAYVSGYCMKKVYGARAALYYEDVLNLSTGEVTRRRPEFVAMSLKPGIGAWWYRRYKNDLFPNDFAVQDAKRWKVPRYYWERFRKDADPDLVEELEYGRYLRAMERREDGTPERRAVREEVALRRLDFFKQRKDL